MSTLVASDLHLGSQLGGDVLRAPAMRERLLREVERCDRVVLLGDVLELRQLPIGRVLELSLPFFEDLGAALGDGGRLVVVAGNHDHHLAAPLLERGRLRRDPPELGLEQLVRAPASGPLGAIARRMPGVEVALAYPGVRIRPDVYALHGHYLDCHMTIPRLEVLAVGAVRRALGTLPEGGATPADYEALLAPVYAFAFALAQGTRDGRPAVGANLSARVWATLNARGRRNRLRATALSRLGIPLVVAGLNRAGVGPLSANLSGRALYRAGLDAIGEVVRRLGIEADHVLYGHTHRAGPLPADGDWRAPGGARLLNTGSWLYEPALVGRSTAESPYWPGNCAVVDEQGPPRLLRLLAGASHEELAAASVPPGVPARPGRA